MFNDFKTFINVGIGKEITRQSIKECYISIDTDIHSTMSGGRRKTQVPRRKFQKVLSKSHQEWRNHIVEKADVNIKR